jgi:hypothetical protein
MITGVGRYYLLPSGDLYIKNVTFDDMGLYKCEAKDVLTKEILTSSLSGQLRVTGKFNQLNKQYV